MQEVAFLSPVLHSPHSDIAACAHVVALFYHTGGFILVTSEAMCTHCESLEAPGMKSTLEIKQKEKEYPSFISHLGDDFQRARKDSCLSHPRVALKHWY